MNKKDVLELRRRLKKETCNINRMAGCYVDAYKNKVLRFNENFLNLPEEEFYKYLDIARKTLGGTIGNNILELAFPGEEEEVNGKQRFFMGLRESDLENEDLLERLYDLIIENYDHTGNFLILVYHDRYDIISRTSDNLKLDESEEVYEYLLTAVCPVELSKPGLGYRQDENRIGARIRDWVVGAPDLGFLFPAFDDHGADIHKVDYFVKDPKDSHAEFAENVLGCGAKRTAVEQKKTFSAIVKRAYGNNEEKGEEVLMDIQESMNNRVEEMEADAENDHLCAPIVLSEAVVNEILEENKVSAEPAKIIREICKEEFADEEPMIENLIDHKALEKSIRDKKEKALVLENIELKRQLAMGPGASAESEDEGSNADVILKVSDDKADMITTRIIDDQKYVLIPVDEAEQISINGTNADI